MIRRAILLALALVGTWVGIEYLPSSSTAPPTRHIPVEAMTRAAAPPATADAATTAGLAR